MRESKPLILAIETSNPSSPEPGSGAGPGVALGRAGGELLGAEPVEGGAHDDALTPAIARLFERAGARPAEIGLVAVSVGPGGYTALRIAVTTAKFIAEACGALCVPVPSAAVAAAACPRGLPFAVALASKDGTCFAQPFGPEGEPAGEGRLIDAAGVEGLGVSRLAADRFLPGPVRSRALELGLELLPLQLSAQAVLGLVSRYSAVNPDEIHPQYPREPEAVVMWRRRHGGA